MCLHTPPYPARDRNQNIATLFPTSSSPDCPGIPQFRNPTTPTPPRRWQPENSPLPKLMAENGFPDTNIPQKRGDFPNLALSCKTLSGLPEAPTSTRRWPQGYPPSPTSITVRRYAIPTSAELAGFSKPPCHARCFPVLSNPPGIPKFQNFWISEFPEDSARPGRIWRNLAGFGKIRNDTPRIDAARKDLGRFRQDLARFDKIWRNSTRRDMTWGDFEIWQDLDIYGKISEYSPKYTLNFPRWLPKKRTFGMPGRFSKAGKHPTRLGKIRRDFSRSGGT